MLENSKEPIKLAAGLVTFRPFDAADRPFLFEVYASSRATEMALVPWDEASKEAFLKHQFEAQLTHYESYNPGATHTIIMLDNNPVGRLYLDREPGKIHILDITLLPQCRGKGVGGAILNELMREALSAKAALRIYVESFNHSLSLFTRLGFRKIEDDGVYFLLEWESL